MKKTLLTILVFLLISGLVYSVSYSDNPYHKLAKDYQSKATDAFDAGEYDLAIEYAEKSAENSDLSDSYIKMMVLKTNAEKQLKYAQNQMARAIKLQGDVYYPMSYSAGKEALDNGLNAYNSEDYSSAIEYAKSAIELLAMIKEVTPLPKFYVVRPWAESKDCYWNISGRSYIYNNPTLWENLYQANKDKMKSKSNPNLIFPGMKLTIPSLSGEIREGDYDPSKKYDVYGTRE